MKNWEPTQEDNIGVITSAYNSIKKQLSEVKKITNCPDNFIYNFIGEIQKEWDPNSCHSIARNKKYKE